MVTVSPTVARNVVNVPNSKQKAEKKASESDKKRKVVETSKLNTEAKKAKAQKR